MNESERTKTMPDEFDEWNRICLNRLLAIEDEISLIEQDRRDGSIHDLKEDMKFWRSMII